MSWANDADAVMVRPATTARIVANATAEDAQQDTPPSSKASSGAASLRRRRPRGCGPADEGRAVAEHQGEQVEGADQPIAQTTDRRASFAVGTV
jgi:hypothetical protein